MSNEPHLEFLYQISVYLDPPLAIGEHPDGNRQIVPITGGSFEGPRLKGKVLAGGADWLLVRPDGVGELDIRYTIQTEDGALIYVYYPGYLTRVLELFPRWAAGEQIPHEEYYFVVTPRYETSAPQYAWLQQVVVLGMGYLIPAGWAITSLPCGTPRKGLPKRGEGGTVFTLNTGHDAMMTQPQALPEILSQHAW